MATVNIGNLTFTHKGDYASGTAYVKNDVVYYSTNGNAYIAKQGTTGNAPTNATYWNQFAQGSGGIWNAGLSLGSAGQVVKVNSGASALEFGDAGGGLQSQQVFTSTGTYTKPSGIKKIKVIVTGAGGGGGSGTGSDNRGGGGGAGGTAIEIIDVSSLSSTVAVTIGTGGTVGSANSNTQGGTGGTSSFGSYCSATGGVGGYFATGTTAQSAGDGGVGSNADINLHGGRGEEHSAQSTQDQSGGGHGGSSYWGGGGRTASAWTSTNATAGEAFGSGGGGGIHDNRAGAVGADGICVVEEYK